MIYVVDASNQAEFADELISAFRLRHRVFVVEQGWHALDRPGQIETDQFDTDDAIHFLALDEAGSQVVGYSRLLPTTGPHLLSDVLTGLAAAPVPQGPTIMEFTRYAVAPNQRGGSPLGNLGARLLFGVLEYAHAAGLTDLTMETDPIWITRFTNLGFDITPLGLPTIMHGKPVIALKLELSEHGIETSRRLLRIKTDAPVTRMDQPRQSVRLPLLAS